MVGSICPLMSDPTVGLSFVFRCLFHLVVTVVVLVLSPKYVISEFFFLIELQRRSVDKKEKEYLRERGVVSETQCDLGRFMPRPRVYGFQENIPRRQDGSLPHGA